MFKFKIFISVVIFAFLLFGTSVIKNQTRILEKKINYLGKEILKKEKDLNETQLDFFYLTSPLIIEKKLDNLNEDKYVPMKHSKIFLNITSFLDLEKKLVIQNSSNEKKK